MSEPDDGARGGKWEPVASVKLPPGLFAWAAEFLIAHGCTLDYGEEEITVTLPPGACRRELFPRTLEERYELRLPDQTIIYEQKLRARKRKGQSILFLPG